MVPIVSTIRLAAIAMGLIVAVLLSPLLLLPLMEGGTTVDWRRLSEIGQTYGAASALLSAIAVVGVSVSLLVQSRQARAEQIYQMHGLHLELIRLEMSDPRLYTPCWGYPSQMASEVDLQRHLYLVLMFDYAWMGYETGAMSQAMLVDMLDKMFIAAPARHHWASERHVWTSVCEGSRRGRAFIATIDDAYNRAASAGPPLPFRFLFEADSPSQPSS